MNTVLFKDKKVSYRVDGDKNNPTVCLLHGFLGDNTIWNRLITEIKNDYQVIAIDLPGHGCSEVIAKTQTMELMAFAIEAVLLSESVNTAHFVGHSMGGYVTLAFGKLFPTKVNSICLLNSTSNEDSVLKQKDRLRAIRIFELNRMIFINEAIENLFHKPYLSSNIEEVQTIKKIAKETSLLGVASSLRGMAQRTNLSSVLNANKSLIIGGVYDNVVPIDALKEISAKTKTELIEITNSAHMSFLEAYEEMRNALLKFWS